MKKHIASPNNRQYKRAEKSFTIGFRRANHEAEKYERSVTRDISSGGVRLTSAQHYQTGDLLELRISPPQNNGQTITVQGRITSTRKISAGIYENGIEFLNIPQDLKKFFQRLEQKAGRKGHAAKSPLPKWMTSLRH